MLNAEIQEIVEASKPWGWVLEPDAKRIFSPVGINVPSFTWSRTLDEALRFAETNGYPVVAKVVSPKAEKKGVWKVTEGQNPSAGMRLAVCSRHFQI